MVYNAGSATLQIVPSFKGVVDSINKQAAQWGTSAGKAFSPAFNTEVGKGTQNAPLGPSEEDSNQQGAKSAGAFGDAFKARIRAAMADLPEAKITADSSDADRAIADIRAQLAELRDAKIGVDISDEDAVAKATALQAQLEALAATSPSVRVQLDTAAAAGQLEAFKAQLDSVGDGGSASGGKWAQDFDKAVTSALGDLPDVPITADSSDAERKLAEIRGELAALHGQTIGVDLSDDEALAKIEVLKADLVVLGASSPNISVKVDAAGAAGELSAITSLQALQQAAQDTEGGLNSLGQDAESSGGEIGAMGPAIAAAVVALIPLAGLAGGALAALPAIFTGIGGAVGVLAIGLGGVSGAVKAYGQEQTKATTETAAATKAQNQAASQAITTAASQRNAAAAVSSAQEGVSKAVTQSSQDQQDALERVGNADQAVADARVQAADQVRQAAEQVQQATEGVASAAQSQANAQQALTDAETQAAASVASAEERATQAAQSYADATTAVGTATAQAALQMHQADESVTSAEQTLATAQRSETTAQQALTQARIDAQAQLVNYGDQLKQGKLDAESDALAITQAQQDLATTLANPGSTALQIAQAKLAVDEATQAAQTQADQYAQLQVTAKAASDAGVEGSTQVTAAQQQVSDATQTTANARQSLADAEAAQTQAELTGQAQIASAIEAQGNAQQALADANAAVTTAEVQGAEQVAQANQAVGNAIQAVADADQALTDANIANSEAQASAAENVQKAQQAAADAATQNSRQAVADAQAEADAQSQLAAAKLAQQDTKAQAKLQPNPNTNNFLGVTIPGAGTAVAAPDDYQTASPQVQALAKYIQNTLKPEWAQFQSQVQAALIPGVTQGLKDLQPLIQPLDGFMTDMAKGAGQFFTNIGKTLSSKTSIKDMTTIFQAGAGFMQDMGTAVEDLTPGFLNMSAKASPIVNGIGKGVDSIAKSFGNWLNGNGFQNFLDWLQTNGPGLVTSLGEMATFLATTIRILTPAGVIFDETLGFFAGLATSLLNFEGLGSSLTGLVTPLSTFVAAWKASWSDIQTSAGAVWAALDTTFEAIEGFFTTDLPAAIDTGVAFFAALPGRAKTAVGDIVGTVFNGLLNTDVWLETNVWTPTSRFFTGVPGRVATVVGNFLGTAWVDLTTAGTWLNLNLWTPTSTFFTNLPGNVRVIIGDFFGKAFAGLLTAGAWLIGNVWNGAGNVIGFFIGLPTDVANLAVMAGTSFFDVAFAGLTGIGGWLNDNLWAPFKKFLNDLPGNIKDLGIWDKVGTIFSDGINKVLGFINTDLIGGVNGLLGDLGLKSLELPTIPLLATGGIVGGPVGGGFITNGPRAIVGEGDPRHKEAVIATDPRYRSNSLRLFAWTGQQLGVPGFAEGGLLSAALPQGLVPSWVSSPLGDVGNLGSKLLSGAAGVLGDVTSSVVGQAFDLLAKPVDAAAGAFPGMFGDLTKGVIDQMLGDIKDFLQGTATSFSSGPNAVGAGGFSSLPSWLGVPYTWGGGHIPGETVSEAMIAGVDCSGLVDLVYGLSGITTDQFRMGSPVSYGDSGPGDLIFFNTGEGAQPGHVGIITTPGGTQMIDAPTTGSVVRYDAMNASGAGFGSIMGVRRFPASVTGIGLGTGATAPPGAGGTPDANRAIAMAQVPAWSTGPEWSALNNLWNRESGWDNTIWNGGSHAATQPGSSSGAYGIAQSLPWSKYPKAGQPPGYGGSADAAAQIAWGIQYILGRYGDPIGAWAHETSIGWYASGGIFNQPTVIGVGEAGKEAVVTPQQLWQFVQTVNPAAAAGPAALQALSAAPAVGRTGPLVSVGEQHFHDEADLAMFMNQANFALGDL